MIDHRMSSLSGLPRSIRAALAVALLGACVWGTRVGAHQQQDPERPKQEQEQEGFRFRSAVELINVTATVSDSNGRFVASLRKEDFIVYEDNEPQVVTHFSNERVPVSLGIAVDTSGSMAGEKMDAAREARAKG